MISPRAFSLASRALRVREHIIRMAGGGGCFIGASLSCADLMVYLYDSVLRISPDDTSNADRDYLLLSKGHDVPALYGTLAEFGYIDPNRLSNHLKPHDCIYWHPNRGVPGVEFHSGSLGHLLSVGIGVAVDVKMCGGTNRIFVMVGDGELDEGSIWEGVLVAAAQRLDNLVMIVDRNGFQANVATEALVPLEPLQAKFHAFGWSCDRVDGHDFEQIAAAFGSLPRRHNQPTAIIADTVRGTGLPSLERRADRWFVSASDQEIEQLLGELHRCAAVVDARADEIS
jgi:transketolase